MCYAIYGGWAKTFPYILDKDNSSIIKLHLQAVKPTLALKDSRFLNF
jgi:hypothetical protein